MTTFVFLLVAAVLSACSGPTSKEISEREFNTAVGNVDHSKKANNSKSLTSERFDATSDDELEQTIMDDIWSKMNKEMSDEELVVSRLTRPQRAIYVIWQVEAEVNNGGFNQFYFNSSGRYAEEAVSAFEGIGAQKFANLMRRANDIYAKEKPRLDALDDGTLEGFSESYDDNPLDALDREYHRLELQENLRDLKVKYIKSIPAASGATSTVATIFNDSRSMISTVPGSDPIPSTVTNAYLSSGETTTPCSTFLFVFNRASSSPDASSIIETD
jgi:hypothetical protein